MTSGQEMEQVYSYNPGAHTGHRMWRFSFRKPTYTGTS